MAEDPGNPSANDAAPVPKGNPPSLNAKSLWNKPVKPVEQKERIDFFSRAEEMWLSKVAEEEGKGGSSW
jgi:hypothetical protein